MRKNNDQSSYRDDNHQTLVWKRIVFVLMLYLQVGEPGKAAHSLRDMGPVNDGGDSVSDATPRSDLSSFAVLSIFSILLSSYSKVCLGPRASILIQHNLSTQKKWRDAK